MALRTNRAEATGVSDGTAVTSALTGTAGTAFSSAAGGGGTRVFSTEQKTSGSYSYKLTTAASASTILVWSGYTSNTVSTAFEFYLTALPTVTSEIVVAYNSAGSIVGRVTIYANGNIGIVEAGSVVVTTLTAGVTANTWYRLEFAVGIGSGTGTLKASLFLASSSTAIVSYNNAARNTGVDTIANFQYGKPISNSAVSLSIYLDNLRADDATLNLLGPDQSNAKVMYTWTGSEWKSVELFAYDGSAWKAVTETLL